ncbi:MAG: general secretion pathway protein GspK [Candidatus Omnitrophica bacterium]|nr:general secretion pathway protein GspK [Candidatus Omnitrophota bacterium]
MLILTLWVLSFLTIFAVSIGLRVRQRVTLVSRLEDRNQLYYVTQAGIQKAIAALRKDYQRSGQNFSSYSKFYRHNNPEIFSSINLGPGVSEVVYVYPENGPGSYQKRYGVIDEESKINVNTADREELKRVIQKTAITDQNQAAQLTEAILSWRGLGEAQLEGFYSDSYYRNLQYPYEPKHASFEIRDELLLLQGMTPDIFEKLSPFITIYGDGQVNINTASRTVLLALGLDETVADKILFVRRGIDGIDFTSDDYIFEKTYDIASEVKQFTELKEGEAKQIDALNKSGKIKTNSFYYLIHAVGQLRKGKEPLSAFCVFNLRDNKIEYYKEGR